MFGKYFSHELKNSYKFPLLSFIICIIAVLVGSLTIKINSEFLISLSVLLIVGSFMFASVALIITLTRQFHSNLFNQQGYLTLTLPVKTRTIILTKILVSFIYAVGFLLMIFLMLFIFTKSQNLRGEFFDALYELLKIAYSGDAFWILVFGLIQTIVGFTTVLFVLLTLGALGHIGLSRGISAVIIIATIIVLMVINSTLQSSEGIPNLYYSYGDQRYYFMSATKMFTLIEQNNYSYDQFREVMNPFIIVYDLVIIFGGYFLSKYLIQNKLELC